MAFTLGETDIVLLIGRSYIQNINTMASLAWKKSPCDELGFEFSLRREPTKAINTHVINPSIKPQITWKTIKSLAWNKVL